MDLLSSTTSLELTERADQARWMAWHIVEAELRQLLRKYAEQVKAQSAATQTT